MIHSYKSLRFFFGDATDSLLRGTIHTASDALKMVTASIAHARINSLAGVKQVHGNNILFFDDAYVPEVMEQADGLITATPARGLMILTGDCMPIILYVQQKNIVGIVHAGWKGVINNIIGHAVHAIMQQYQVDPADIEIIIGPHARVCCYQIQQDVAQLVSDAGHQAALHYRQQEIYFNMLTVVYAQLAHYAISQTAISITHAACTIDNENFCSWRRMATDKRNINIAYISR